ncbi:ABC transporter substrate-binding protein [Pontibacter silvestris]|uniref:ABC transporter substrate-binding protein n=1 Tax=Pontibacter silvestris TaxID=2305183 RepID=A0ABW4WT24_9BACT|nr:helical backbone metal receptor [Pontibacter silvestris]MCC9138127.1 helical backbone metal receptor [Pontibacter silvestris]
MGQQVLLQKVPQRIISLVPSQTELLFSLGLGSRVVGVTKFCIHPKEQTKQKAVIGGTKNFHFEKIDKLQPDLIIGNKEENYKEGVAQLRQKHQVWMSDIYTLEDALHMIQQVGLLTGTESKAGEITQSITQAFNNLQPFTPAISTVYFIWREPYMAVGDENFIDHILQKCGFINTFTGLARYPEITPERLQQANPQLVLLSSEPYPFKEKHIAEFKALCPQAHIKVIDGEMFSWYGSRLLYASAYLQQLVQEIQQELK